MKTSPPGVVLQPINHVAWIPREDIEPNSYNPNAQDPPEFKLLKISILCSGWTQPIVARKDTKKIVDGEHRWTVAGDKDVAFLTGGLVPVVWLEGDDADLMMATIRHNRARGQHGVTPMSSIVRELLKGGVPAKDVMEFLQMEAEEVERLAEVAGMPVQVGEREAKDFGKSWIPELRK